MKTIRAAEVRQRLEELAPPALAESWDNVGWQVGHDGAAIRAVLVTLDVDAAVVDEAAAAGANLIVAHHPLLFRGVKRINPTDYMGRMLRRLLCDEIHVFAAHTNLDAVRAGVNGALAEALGFQPSAPLVSLPASREGWGFGAQCESEPLTTEQIAQRVHERLGTPHPRITRALDAPATHRRIALMGGSGASLLEEALRAGCTFFVTGEIKYHEAQDAARAGLSVVEAGHYFSERPVLARVAQHLSPLGIPVTLSRTHTTPFEFVRKDVLP